MGFVENHGLIKWQNLWKAYRVAKGNLDFLKNMLLLKNPQFLPNQYETLSKKKYLWVPYFGKVSQWSGINCGFFNKSIFLRKSTFAFATLYGKMEILFGCSLYTIRTYEMKNYKK